MLSGTHAWPGKRLDVGQDLTQVVGIMVDPFVEEVIDGEKPDFGVIATASKIIGRQRLH